MNKPRPPDDVARRTSRRGGGRWYRKGAPELQAATARPWFAHFSTHGDPYVVADPTRPGFTTIATVSTGPDDYGRANALLIVEAVNGFDGPTGALSDHVDVLAAAMNDAQIDPQEMRLGRDLRIVARRIAEKFDAARGFREEAELRPDPRCRLHGQPREGEWSCSCHEETEFESAEEHIVRMALR